MTKEIHEMPLIKGTPLLCVKAHPDGMFTVGERYKVNAYQVWGNYAGVRIRDDKRERKDFNFIPTSKNYIWTYFRIIGGNNDESTIKN